MSTTPTLGASVLTPQGVGKIIAIEPTISTGIEIFHVQAASGIAAYYEDELIVLDPIGPTPR